MQFSDRRVCVGFLVAALVALMAASATVAQSGSSEKAKAAYREGNGLFDRGRFTEAAAAYDTAIAEEPQYAEAYHNRALACEMIDRQQALEAWKRFIDISTGREEFKFDVARIQARLKILESLPTLPEPMQPKHYVADAGDYYLRISRTSEGEEWKHLPVKVFLGSAPQMKWQEGAREAFDTWSEVFPTQLVALRREADIRLDWAGQDFPRGQVGEDREWVEFKREGNELMARRIAVITVDVRFPWSKDEMRAFITHEMGHALGIKGHSDDKKDIMYWQAQEKKYGVAVPRVPLPIFWRALVKRPSPRDINTLIRIYNHAGSSVRFR